MSNQFRRRLVGTMFSPASFRRFFRQHPGVVATELAYGTSAAALILTLTGLNYWLPDPRHSVWESFSARRKRCSSVTADLEMLEREIDSIKAKQLHTRVQKEDTKADDLLLVPE